MELEALDLATTDSAAEPDGRLTALATLERALTTPELADRMELAVAQPGDLVVVFQSGAYGATASPQAFLGHPPCPEVLV